MKINKMSSIFCAAVMVVCSVLIFGIKSQAAIGLSSVSITQPVYGVIKNSTAVYSDSNATKAISGVWLQNGTYITIVGYANDVFRVQYTNYGPTYAYIPSDNVTSYESRCPGKVLANTTTDPLNVRAGASTSNTVIGQMPHGAYAPAVTAQNMNGFYNIVWGTMYGYVSADYAYYIAY